MNARPRDALAETLAGALARAAAAIGARGVREEDVELAPPLRGGRGDLATGLALRLAPGLGRPAAEVAESLAARIEPPTGLVARVEPAGAGFLNFWLDDAAVARAVGALAAELAPALPDQGGRLVLAESEATIDQGRALLVVEVLSALGAGPGPEPVPVGPVTLVGDDRVRRSGRRVPLAELAAELGEDAARYALFSRRAEAGLTIELSRWRRPTEVNPAWRAQMAHARLSGIFRSADVPEASAAGTPDPAALGASDLRLLHLLPRLPGALARAARGRDPHAVAWFLDGLADGVLAWTARDPAPTPDRLRLARASQLVVANALTLLGLAAPDWI